jgi:hypothetical protein
MKLAWLPFAFFSQGKGVYTAPFDAGTADRLTPMLSSIVSRLLLLSKK